MELDRTAKGTTDPVIYEDDELDDDIARAVVTDPMKSINFLPEDDVMTAADDSGRCRKGKTALSIYLFICLSIYLSIHASIYISIQPYVCLYATLNLLPSFSIMYVCKIYRSLAGPQRGRDVATMFHR